MVMLNLYIIFPSYSQSRRWHPLTGAGFAGIARGFFLALTHNSEKQLCSSTNICYKAVSSEKLLSLFWCIQVLVRNITWDLSLSPNWHYPGWRRSVLIVGCVCITCLTTWIVNSVLFNLQLSNIVVPLRLDACGMSPPFWLFFLSPQQALPWTKWKCLFLRCWDKNTGLPNGLLKTTHFC